MAEVTYRVTVEVPDRYVGRLVPKTDAAALIPELIAAIENETIFHDLEVLNIDVLEVQHHEPEQP